MWQRCSPWQASSTAWYADARNLIRPGETFTAEPAGDGIHVKIDFYGQIGYENALVLAKVCTPSEG